MARISLYVTDELKARMDEAPDVNWSDVARPAFLMALAVQKQRSEQTMQNAIERLRASKEAVAKRDDLEGKAHGREWAEQSAEYDDLKRVSAIEVSFSTFPLEELQHAIDPSDDLSLTEFCEQIFGDGDAPSEEYAAAFIRGAQEFFAEASKKI